jgi:hypothetical protein
VYTRVRVAVLPEVRLLAEAVMLPEPSGATGKVMVTAGLEAIAVSVPVGPPLDFATKVAVPALFGAVTVKDAVIVWFVPNRVIGTLTVCPEMVA